MNKYLRKMDWKDGAAIGLWGILFVAVLMVFAATVFAISYSSTAGLSESCRAATQDSCVRYGRTASLALLGLAICLTLGALQVCRIVNVRNSRKGLHWKILRGAAKANFNLNPTLTRFALATSLICAPTIALYLGWLYVFEPNIDPGLPIWARDCTAVVIIFSALWMVVESFANWRTIKSEIGDWKRGVLSALTLVFFEWIKIWAGWSWSHIAAVTGSITVAIAFWRWALHELKEDRAEVSPPRKTIVERNPGTRTHLSNHHLD